MTPSLHFAPIIPTTDEVAAEKQKVYLKAVSRAFAFWQLTNQESADLFDVPIATWNRMKAGKFRGRLDRDKIIRASLAVGLFKGLGTVFNGPVQNGWPKHANSNPLFNGQTPLAFMIDGGIPAMMETRNYVDAVAQGY
jgi:hypothetical protein